MKRRVVFFHARELPCVNHFSRKIDDELIPLFVIKSSVFEQGVKPKAFGRIELIRTAELECQFATQRRTVDDCGHEIICRRKCRISTIVVENRKVLKVRIAIPANQVKHDEPNKLVDGIWRDPTQ